VTLRDRLARWLASLPAEAWDEGSRPDAVVLVGVWDRPDHYHAVCAATGGDTIPPDEAYGIVGALLTADAEAGEDDEAPPLAAGWGSTEGEA
jgi:hypothetical protein